MAPLRMQLSLAAGGEMLSLDPHTSIRWGFDGTRVQACAFASDLGGQ